MILRRLESKPPTITKTEIGAALEHLQQLGLLRQAEPARSLPCPECDGSRNLQVEFIKDNKTGRMHGFIACPECGTSEIDPRKLERWRIDPVAMLRAVLVKLTPAPREPTEVIPGQLWNAGKVHLLGQLREIFFIAGYRSATGSSVVEFLRTRTRCIVLMPSEIGVARWGAATNNLVMAIESFAALQATGIELNLQQITSRVAAHFGDRPEKSKPKRRSSRLADIEALKRELIQHIRDARDLAVNTYRLPGGPKLLPRPSKEELGQRAGVKPHGVSRCFSDPAGTELQWLWDMADDVNRVLDYRGI